MSAKLKYKKVGETKMKEQEHVNYVSEMVNVMGFKPKEFCKFMENEHRTLQENFTDLCIEWLYTCASDKYLTDGRNIYSHRASKIMIDALEESYKL